MDSLHLFLCPKELALEVLLLVFHVFFLDFDEFELALERFEAAVEIVVVGGGGGVDWVGEVGFGVQDHGCGHLDGRD